MYGFVFAPEKNYKYSQPALDVCHLKHQHRNTHSDNTISSVAISGIYVCFQPSLCCEHKMMTT